MLQLYFIMQPQKPSDQQLGKIAEQAIEKLKQINEDPKWQRFSQKPCLMYKLQIENRLMSKGTAIVGLSFQFLCKKLSQNQSLKEIDPQLKQFKDLHKFTLNGTQVQVTYLRYFGIWPVQDRDLVLVSVQKTEGNICYIATKSCGYPYPDQNKVTRAHCHIGGYIIKKIDDQKCEVTYISDVDLAGSIPQMIKNQIAQKQAQLPAGIEKALKK